MLKSETELAKMAIDVEKIRFEIDKVRADMRNDERRTFYQGMGLLVGGLAAGAALVTATIALTKAFL